MIANVQRLDTLKANPLTWLWFPFLASGAVTVVEGEPSAGKSLFVVDVLARLSRGGPMPDGQQTSEAKTLLLTPEMSVERQLLPRLLAAGAKVENLFSYAAPGGESLDLEQRLATIEQVLEQQGIHILVIDSLEAFLPDPLRPRQRERLRKLLAALAELAARRNIAVVVVAQSEGTKRSAFAALGSIGVTLRVGPGERETERVVEMTRSVIGPRRPAMLFQLVGERDVRLEPVVQVEMPVETVEKPASELERAMTWLAALLATGPCWLDDILARGMSAGFSQRTLERAKAELDLVSNSVKVEGKRQSFWLRRDQANATPPLRSGVA